MNGLDEFLNVVEDNEFDEIPVDLETFLYDEDYLGLPKLSGPQVKLIEALTQIYRKETLEKLWGTAEANRLWKTTFREVIFQLGKGSGKDYMSGIAFARIVYLLLCLKDPARYYGKPRGDAIHLLNVAVNAKQANNVFFKGFKARIESCPWFEGRYHPLSDNIEFEKNITAHSGHSEREAWEGYNLIIVVLDEIAAFATEAETTGDNRIRGKTAEAIYKMYSRSVTSRFPKMGKLALLSFPRYKGDFIQKRYEEVIGEKITTIQSHTFKVHDDLPDGTGGNEFTIEWEDDRIISYKQPNIYALKKPTWEINPLISIDDFKAAFMDDPEDSLSRFACMPPEAIDAFFKDKEKILKAFTEERHPPFNPDWSFKDSFVPDKEAEYYLHVDLGYTHDRAAVVMSHVKEWVQMVINKHAEYSPVIVVDAMRYWTPRPDKNIDFGDIEDFIVALRHRGFNIKLVTFDKWNSVEFRARLKSDYGIETDLLSVAKPHYQDLAVGINSERLVGYYDEILIDELLGLRIIRGNKVDHTRKGSKDIADALAGSVFNSVAHSKRKKNRTVEVRFLSPSAPSDDRIDYHESKTLEKSDKPMPTEMREFIRRMKVI